MATAETHARPAVEMELLERSEFVEALGVSFGAVAGGDGRLVFISGEAGIGKSALVRRFCDERRLQARLLRGACDALATPRPLSPFIDVAAQVRGPLAACIGEGGKPYAVFVALAEEVRRSTPTIVVIEDVHWADEATLDVIRLLARRAETLRALVIVTLRDDQLDASHPLRRALGELGTAPGVEQLRLPSLSPEAVAALARAHGVDGGDLYRKTAGNPFFVTEVLAGGDTTVPPTVRDAVLSRISRLGSGARGILEAVAIVPPHVELWLLGEAVRDEDA